MKKSSYQKLKEENERLKKDLHTLVNEPNSRRSIELNVIYLRPKMTPLSGFRETNKPFVAGGFLSTIQNLIDMQMPPVILKRQQLPEYPTDE